MPRPPTSPPAGSTSVHAVGQSIEASAGQASDVSVLFTQQGSLGLDLREDPGPSVSIERIHPGGQAVQHAALKKDLTVLAVAGKDVRGKSLDDVGDLIIAHPERPLVMRFG